MQPHIRRERFHAGEEVTQNGIKCSEELTLMRKQFQSAGWPAPARAEVL